jgi:hypothetical protein
MLMTVDRVKLVGYNIILIEFTFTYKDLHIGNIPIPHGWITSSCLIATIKQPIHVLYVTHIPCLTRPVMNVQMKRKIKRGVKTRKFRLYYNMSTNNDNK